MPEAERQDQNTAQPYFSHLPQPKEPVSPNGSSPAIGGADFFGKIEQDVTEISIEVATQKTNEIMQKNLPRYTEVLGVFAALFTFVSVEIQVFSRVVWLSEAVLFTFLLFLCMVGFLFVLHMVMNLDGSLRYGILTLLGLLFVVGVGGGFFYYLIHNNIPLSKPDDIFLDSMGNDIEKNGRTIEEQKQRIDDLYQLVGN